MQQDSNGVATASLVIAVAGMFLILAVPVLALIFEILAIVLGIAGRRRVAADPSIGGKALATAGIVVGIGVLVVCAVVLVLILYVFDIAD